MGDVAFRRSYTAGVLVELTGWGACCAVDEFADDGDRRIARAFIGAIQMHQIHCIRTKAIMSDAVRETTNEPSYAHELEVALTALMQVLWPSLPVSAAGALRQLTVSL